MDWCNYTPGHDWPSVELAYYTQCYNALRHLIAPDSCRSTESKTAILRLYSGPTYMTASAPTLLSVTNTPCLALGATLKLKVRVPLAPISSLITQSLFPCTRNPREPHSGILDKSTGVGACAQAPAIAVTTRAITISMNDELVRCLAILMANWEARGSACVDVIQRERMMAQHGTMGL